ncbi:UDP-glucose dehydrogenase family protein [Peribacillus frigoritolerans]|uniref:UDP-glucose dehydrogenase family protein n=1 Tax=Peribacillus frigoritolerans TaxID=450367 RepID=UPI003D073FA2
MKITIIGTGYVGLVTAVCLSDIGHNVTCIDIDKVKIEQLKNGISPIYEPGLEDLMLKNIKNKRLFFTHDYYEGFKGTEVIYIAVGTPQKPNGEADLSFIETVAKEIAYNINKYVVIVTKSTVPVGTNDNLYKIIKKINKNIDFDIVSNPEFLREGSAIKDTFHGDRIVIGSNNQFAASVIEEINKPFNVPIYKTDIKSAEMIKHASNAFLATKISFINEISNICEKVGADIEQVAFGMGLDKRIGSQFLKAGIGYGGSCFPKDTNALVQIADKVQHDFDLLKSVIKVNNNQQLLLVNKAKESFGELENKRIAVLGLAFKPNTDDIRESASLVIIDQLVKEGASVIAYDPIAIENTRAIMSTKIEYSTDLKEAITNAEMVFILTDWDEIKNINLNTYVELMKNPVILDGRNCYNIEDINEEIDYISIGRVAVRKKIKALNA